MYSISGKSLIFTDLHIGLKSDSLSRMEIVKKVISQIISTIHKENIKNVFFLGDLFHSRSFLNVNTINLAIQVIQDISGEVQEVFLVVGNHDIYYKTKTDVNSVKMFDSIKNVHIIQKPTKVLCNDDSILLVPWMTDISKIPNEAFEIVMGHFDIPANYLIKSYIEENKSKSISTNDLVIDLISQDGLFANTEQVNMMMKSDKSSEEYLGDFIDKVKPHGLIFSGHIHAPKTFTIRKNRTFTFVGSPYEQTLGEIGNECGFVILNEDGSYEKRLTKNIPRHFIVKNSEIIKLGFDNYFNLHKSDIAGNIIKWIIDTEGNKGLNQKIQDAISVLLPYEELPPEYNATISTINFDDISNDASSKILTENIKTSKVDYIVEYINQMDESELKNLNITKDKLLEVFKVYIEKLSSSSGKYEINV